MEYSKNSGDADIRLAKYARLVPMLRLAQACAHQVLKNVIVLPGAALNDIRSQDDKQGQVSMVVQPRLTMWRSPMPISNTWFPEVLVVI